MIRFDVYYGNMKVIDIQCKQLRETLFTRNVIYHVNMNTVVAKICDEDTFLIPEVYNPLMQQIILN